MFVAVLAPVKCPAMPKRRPTGGKDDLHEQADQIIKQALERGFEETYRHCKALATDPTTRSTARGSVAVFLGFVAVRWAFYSRDYERTGRCNSETVQVYAPA